MTFSHMQNCSESGPKTETQVTVFSIVLPVPTMNLGMQLNLTNNLCMYYVIQKFWEYRQ